MKQSKKRGSFLLMLAATVGAQGCCEEPAAPVSEFGASWTTEAEFEFGESVGGSPEARFGLISAGRVLGDGDRILVVEAASPRATIWTPDGSLLRDGGRPREGPGEFAGQFGIQMHRSGFTAIDNAGQRFTSFSSDGTFIESIPFPRSGHPSTGASSLSRASGTLT